MKIKRGFWGALLYGMLLIAIVSAVVIILQRGSSGIP